MRRGIHDSLSNKDYHEATEFLSSSMIKLMVQSPELYYKTYIQKDIKKEYNDAFDVGTAIHARILEPDEYAKTVVFFSGRRSGKDWEVFRKENAEKIILGDLQKMQIDRMYNSFINSTQGPELLSGGFAEVSLFTQLDGKDIKVRADYLDVRRGSIFDVKSTSGIITEEGFRYKAEGKLYGYDLQAALYADAYSKHFQQEFDFYWIVISKDYNDIKFFKASTAFLEQGRKKYENGIALIKKYENNAWNFEESIIELNPSSLFLGDF